MESIRCNTQVFKRADASKDWTQTQYDSISLAKKANGLNARTVQSPKNLPPKVEAEA